MTENLPVNVVADTTEACTIDIDIAITISMACTGRRLWVKRRKNKTGYFVASLSWRLDEAIKKKLDATFNEARCLHKYRVYTLT